MPTRNLPGLGAGAVNVIRLADCRDWDIIIQRCSRQTLAAPFSVGSYVVAKDNLASTRWWQPCAAGDYSPLPQSA
jgi:hypothetical protein